MPILVWKQIYTDYQTIYLDSYLTKKNPQGLIVKHFEGIKIGTSNQEGSEKTTFLCDQVLKCLKATNGHVTRNVLKRRQS
jgi:hypothetical protein